MDLKTKIFSVAIIVSLLGGFYAGRKSVKPEIKEVTYTDTVTQERIVEIPGQGRTIYRTIKEKKKATSTKIVKKEWLVGISQNMFVDVGGTQVQTISIQKLVFSNLYFGVYGRTDKEYGIGLTYQF